MTEEMKEEKLGEGLGNLFASLFGAMNDIREKYTFESEIKWPATIRGIKKGQGFIRKSLTNEQGQLVKVRPCGEEYGNKTFLGIYIADLTIDMSVRIEKETQTLEIHPHTNPAIFVPELKKLVFGCESWWGPIESEEELKAITNEDIQSVWYVQLLKAMLESKKGESDESRE